MNYCLMFECNPKETESRAKEVVTIIKELGGRIVRHNLVGEYLAFTEHYEGHFAMRVECDRTVEAQIEKIDGYLFNVELGE